MALWTPAQLSSSILQQGTPAGNAGLANNDPVASWADASGFGVAAEQAVSGRRPLWKTNILNGFGAVRFDGTDDFLRLSNFDLDGAYSYFIVAKANQANNEPLIGADGGEGRFGVDGSGNLEINAGGSDVGGAHTTGAFHIYAAIFNGASSKVFVDGTQIGSTGNAGSGVPSVFYLGAQDDIGTAYFDGDIVDYLILRGAATDAQRQQVEGFYGNTYALRSNLASSHPYRQFPPLTQTLWTPALLEPFAFGPRVGGWMSAPELTADYGDGDTVTSWDPVQSDVATTAINARTLTNVSGTPTLQTNERNGLAVVRTDGVDDVLSGETGNGEYQLFNGIYLVAKVADAADQRLIDWGGVTESVNLEIDAAKDVNILGSSPPGASGAAITLDAWHIIKYWNRSDDPVTGLSVDFGTPVTPDSFSYSDADRLTLGANEDGGVYSLFAAMDIGEMIQLYTHTLDSFDDDEARLDGYFAWRWGFVDDLDVAHPYKSVPPEVGADARGTLDTTISVEYTLNAAIEIEEDNVVAAGDTIRVRLRDVTHLDDGAVTSGLGGTAEIQQWEDAEDVEATAPIVSNDDDDWYVDFTAPAIGHYRVVANFTAGGASRTLAAELRVVDPPT